MVLFRRACSARAEVGKDRTQMELFAPKRILCPVDLSATSSLVLQWAALFAETYEAKLEVLLADAPEYPPYFLPSQEVDLARQAEQRGAALRQALEKVAAETLSPTASPDIAVVEGHPAQAILERVQEHPPDLIVMGSHGRSGVARMRLGSVAETIVREAHTPTLVARACANRPGPPAISRLLCPVSFSAHARQCLDVSADIASRFGAQLIVVHSAEREAPDLHAVRSELCRWISAHARPSCDVIEVVRQGNAAEQIVLAAREHSVDLLVLAAKHHPFLEFTTFGTTAERVMRHADSAVLILPSGSGD